MAHDVATCSACGKAVSQKLLGLCPQCMLKAALATETSEAAAPSRFEPPTLEQLARYFPQLEILEFIGRGGMGAVYKARQKDLDRIVALKILPPGISGAKAQPAKRQDADEQAFAARFTREARALAALAHPNIVTLYEFGQTFAIAPPSSPPQPPDTGAGAGAGAGGIFYFLMEFVDGVNLRQLLGSRKLAPKEALAIVPPICDALQYAHDRGIVHRDIKPENILLSRHGVVKIADFGVAKIVGRSDVGAQRRSDEGNETQAAAVGTPAYMAPEQMERPADVDHRADIYSLGVVLYQMLTGELPAKQLEAPSRKVQIDVRLDEIVLRALAHSPEMRYSKATLFKTAVETVSGERAESRKLKPETGKEEYAEASILPPAQDSERFSRTALLGAFWSMFAGLAAMFWGVSESEHAPGKTLTTLGYVLAITLIPLGATAPLGTTILGWVAIAQIRRSAGRLYGLGLAVFDGLLFPLLALTGLVAWFWWWVFRELLYPHQIDGLRLGSEPVIVSRLEDFVFNHWLALIILSTSFSSACLCILIVRRTWRAVHGGAAPQATGDAMKHRQGAAKLAMATADSRRVPEWYRWLSVVGVRDGKRVANWHAVGISAVGILLVGMLLFVLSPGTPLNLLTSTAILLWLAASIAIGVFLGKKRWPLHQLPSLDAPSHHLRLAWGVTVGIGLLAAGILSIYHSQRQQIEQLEMSQRLFEGQIIRKEMGIEQRLRAMGLNWDSYRIELVPNSSRSIWHFTALKELKDESGWKEVEGTLIIEPLPSGVLQVRGERGLGHILFTMPEPSAGIPVRTDVPSPPDMTGPARSPATTQASAGKRGGAGNVATLGPVIERTISNEGLRGGTVFVDLDSRLVNVEVETPIGHLQRLKEAGHDLFFAPGSEELAGIDLVIVAAKGDSWSSATAPAIASELTTQPAVTAMLLSQLPRTYLFRTREGGMGILQILSIAQDRRSIEVRYRMAQASPEGPASAPAAAPEQRVPGER